MDKLDYQGLVMAEREAVKELLREAKEVDDPVGVLQFTHKLKELDDELAAL